MSFTLKGELHGGNFLVESISFDKADCPGLEHVYRRGSVVYANDQIGGGVKPGTPGFINGIMNPFQPMFDNPLESYCLIVFFDNECAAKQVRLTQVDVVNPTFRQSFLPNARQTLPQS